ncbi:MAG: iron-containing alcohol dehydrogenase [Clostridia bacterium]|nr:iron-containing alcohol dehydrogenase [Clostridia bacterium]
MKDFMFSLPTKIIFGRGAECRAGEFAAQYGTSAMLLYGSERIRRSGLLERLASDLHSCGVQVTEFGGIVENPSLSKAEEGCRLARAAGVDLLIAVGGGSVIDTAKAVSVGAAYEGPLWDLYEKKGTAGRSIPIGVVLTMAATASEANCVSVLHNTEEHRKLSLTEPLTCPKFALLDPELTFTVPPYQTAAGSVDIFAHAFERYFHKEQSCTLRDLLCESVMRTVVEELPNALARPDSYEARSQLMWTATLAHSNVIGQEGDFACHALSHVLTAELGMVHGAALGVLMIAWCKYMLATEEEAVAKFAAHVWRVPDGGSRTQTAQNGISEFQNFICSAGLPVTLREHGAASVDVERLAAMALTGTEGYVGNGYFRPLYQRDIVGILQLAAG